MTPSRQFGLKLLTTSVIGIMLVIALDLINQLPKERAAIQQNGTNVINLLAQLPATAFTSDSDGRIDTLKLNYRSNHPAFAYTLVTDLSNKPVSIVRSQQHMRSELVLEPIETVEQGQRTIVSNNGKSYSEFYMPVLREGELIGHIRIAFQNPGLTPFIELIQSHRYAYLALLVFVLAGAIYLFVKNELRPLRDILGDIGANNTLLSQKQETPIDDTKTHAITFDFSTLASKANDYIQSTQQRMQDLSGENNSLYTERKLVEYKLRRTEIALSALPDGVMLLDHSGTVSYTNGKVSALLNIQSQDIVGKKPQVWCNHKEILSFLGRYGTNAAPLKTSDITTISLVVNRQERFIQCIASPLILPGNESVDLGTLIHFRDITEEQLANQNRGEFIAQVAHEMKTPLNVIAMYSESLIDNEDYGADASETRVDAINTIHDETERLSTLINNMLSITKFELDGMSTQMQRVRIVDLLVDAFKAIAQSQKAKTLELKLSVPKDLSSVVADKDLLRVAVNNLLTNAVKYNTEGGSIRLEAYETDRDVIVHVTDTGVGIAPEEQDRVFEKFYRSNDDDVRQQTGHGLGLALVKQIIQLHNGDIDLDSTPGKGSKFTIRIPKNETLLQQAV